jgi:hypothetical protein
MAGQGLCGKEKKVEKPLLMRHCRNGSDRNAPRDGQKKQAAGRRRSGEEEEHWRLDFSADKVSSTEYSVQYNTPYIAVSQPTRSIPVPFPGKGARERRFLGSIFGILVKAAPTLLVV